MVKLRGIYLPIAVNLMSSLVNDTDECPAMESIGASAFRLFAKEEISDDLPAPGNPSAVMLKSVIYVTDKSVEMNRS